MRSLALDQIEFHPLPVEDGSGDIAIRGTLSLFADERHNLRAYRGDVAEMLKRELGQRIRNRIGHALYKQQREGLNAIRSAFRDFRLTVQPSNWSTTNEKLQEFMRTLAALEESMT